MKDNSSFEDYIKNNQQVFFSVARVITKNRDLAIECTVLFFSEIYGLFNDLDFLDNKVELYKLFLNIIRDVLKKSDRGYMLYLVEDEKEDIKEKNLSNIYDKKEFYKNILDSADSLGYIFREIIALSDVALLSKNEILSILDIEENEYFFRMTKAKKQMIYNLKTKI